MNNSTNQSNVCSDNQQHTIISNAQQTIEAMLAREATYKQKVMQSLLQAINKICKENDLQYFAIGKLLTQYIYQKDSYPEKRTYIIGFLRKDYDDFFKFLRPQAKELGIQIRQIYDKNGTVKRLHSCIRKKELFMDEIGTLELTIDFRIECYEYLPNDIKEQNKFCQKLAKMSREYRAISRYILELNADMKPKTPEEIQKLKEEREKLYADNYFLNFKKTYRKYLKKYANLDSPKYVGRIELLIYPTHCLDEIFPIQTKSFLGTELMIPAQCDKFYSPLSEEQDIQIVNGRIEALKQFDQLCTEYNISYFAMKSLASGCNHVQDYLPATEHSPWHLGLLRNDYEKVVSLLENMDVSQELILDKTVEEYPLVHKEHIGFLLKSYTKKNPEEHNYVITLLPFDIWPKDYNEQIQFKDEVVKASITMEKLIDAEKGLTLAENDTLSLTTSKQFKITQQLMQKYNAQDNAPKQIFTILNAAVHIYTMNEVFPLQRKPFNKFSILCTNNPYLWHTKKDDDFTEYIASERTKILKILDNLCEKNKIAYFAIANLLIGAVVYHDAVPGSDAKAMDIALLRQDYNALLKLLRNHAVEYGIQLNEFLDTSHKYPLDTKTVSFIDGENSNIKIALIPFDKLPEDFYLQAGFKEDIDKHYQEYCTLFKYQSNLQIELEVPESAWESLKQKWFLKHADLIKEANKLEKFVQTYNQDESSSTYRRLAFGRSKSITTEQLFPLQKVPFRDMMINCPRDYTPWQPVLNSELERQVASIQKADLMLMEEFDKICQKLKIGYFICGGTMLGYMRHQGFIPWDDDVDVAMLRADYDRFLAEAGPLMPEGFFLQTRESDPNIPYLFSKIRLDRTEYITQYNENRDFHKGICLDIFPFDYLPNKKLERKAFIDEIINLSKEHNIIANRQYPKPEEPCNPHNKLERHYYEEQEQKRQYYWSQNLAESQKTYIEAATRYNSQAQALGLTTVASFVPSYTYIDLKDLLPYQRGFFEGIEVSVPKRPDIFLKMQYGDYMSLPPKHMQVAHRLLRWSTWEASCE